MTFTYSKLMPLSRLNRLAGLAGRLGARGYSSQGTSTADQLLPHPLIEVRHRRLPHFAAVQAGSVGKEVGVQRRPGCGVDNAVACQEGGSLSCGVPRGMEPAN